jgi:hypothetical protein
LGVGSNGGVNHYCIHWLYHGNFLAKSNTNNPLDPKDIAAAIEVATHVPYFPSCFSKKTQTRLVRLHVMNDMDFGNHIASTAIQMLEQTLLPPASKITVFEACSCLKC